MFEIGSSLRDARRKRGLELDAVQRELRIRRRYLEALENERFDLLPGEVYARGFLREYADFLGLDSTLYVQEYNARFSTDEEVPIAVVPSARSRGRPRRRRAPLALLGAIALVLVGAIAAWQVRDGGERTASTSVARPTPRTHVAPVTPVAQPAPKPVLRRLSLHAARGTCWLLVRRGSADGPVLFERTLQLGETVSFRFRTPLWLRVGAGGNVDAMLDGKPFDALPAVVGDVVVGARV